MKKNHLKTFALVLVIGLLVAAVCSVGNIAFAEQLTGDEYDKVFISAVEELALTDETYELTAQKEVVHDINLHPFGYVYDYTLNGVRGYAVVVNTLGVCEVAELVPQGECPIEHDETAKFIYVTFETFLKYSDGNYYWVGSDVALTDEEIASLREVSHYFGGTEFTYSDETVYFTNRTENTKKLVALHPRIAGISGLTNACAVNAGANLIQYWDRLCENLIPNYVAYTTLGGQYAYKGSSTTLNDMALQLGADMKTNVDAPGTTVANFKNGIKVYSKRQGYNNVSYSSCMSFGKFNYNSAKQKLDNNQPLAIFCEVYTVTELTKYNDHELLDNMHGYGTHTMAVFGYKEITYTLANGSTRVDKYLSVASGLGKCPSAFYNINYNTTIDDCFSVVIS